jgi:hypothetical protein
MLLPPIFKVLKSALESSQDCLYKIISFLYLSHWFTFFLSFCRHKKSLEILILSAGISLDVYLCKEFVWIMCVLQPRILFKHTKCCFSLGLWSNYAFSVKASAFFLFMVCHPFKMWNFSQNQFIRVGHVFFTWVSVFQF